jgi:hypothetical protein
MRYVETTELKVVRGLLVAGLLAVSSCGLQLSLDGPGHSRFEVVVHNERHAPVRLVYVETAPDASSTGVSEYAVPGLSTVLAVSVGGGAQYGRQVTLYDDNCALLAEIDTTVNANGSRLINLYVGNSVDVVYDRLDPPDGPDLPQPDVDAKCSAVGRFDRYGA